MAAVTLEVDDELLARAEVAAKHRGTDLKSSLFAEIRRLARDPRSPEERRAALEESFRRADLNPIRIEGGMPSREERNAR